jgi:hypothetical protein
MRLLYVLGLGIALAIIGFFVGGLLFPSNNQDLSDITQGFLQLVIAFIGLVGGLVIGGMTAKYIKR